MFESTQLTINGFFCKFSTCQSLILHCICELLNTQLNSLLLQLIETTQKLAIIVDI